MAEGSAPGGYLTGLHARWLAERPDQRHQEIEGTLLFADVSGFTVLGEKLARQGRIGAEILTETVNTVFAGMLDVVTSQGGEILKFGGDAILALFTGDEHEARGASAGLGLQAMLRAMRRERSVNLRLSAGVASGNLNLFLAGEAPRELIVAGPLASEVLTHEAAAEAGQVLVSPATAAALPDGCVGPDGQVRRVPAVAAVAPPAMPDIDTRPGLPVHLHDHRPGDGEHRSVTIAFLQFRGTDDLLAAEGADALAQGLDDVVGAAAAAALAHGVTFVGTDVDRNAGKVILAAGAPTASPDDDDRMLHALREVVAAPHRLEVRAGVNRGRVFTVDIGPEQRRTWTVMGDDVNLAARVMGAARPGTVLATRSVLARLRDEFGREPVPPFNVKGKSSAVFAEEVHDAKGARRSATVDAPLVGREEEVARLLEALSEARLGANHVIELSGEPGIGKSRLIEALADELRGLPLLLVQGGPYSAHSPYRALRAPLRQLLGVRADDPADAVAERLAAQADADPDLAPWLPLIAIPFGVDLPPTPETAALAPEFARGRLVEWTVRLVDRLLEPGPVALIVEDGHWVDDASADVIRALVRVPRPAGRLVVSTRRDVAEGMSLEDLPGTQTIALLPLDAAAALSLIGHGGEDHALPPGDEARLVERAGGNPLLLSELIAAARAGESVDALPDSVEALVTARIDTLPRDDRRLLREAAVLGIHVQAEVLQRLLDADESALQSALSRLDDFLVPTGPQTVRFRHALLRDAAYETLPFRRRRELHARAAELIESSAGESAPQQAELLAIHFHVARRWEEAWRYGRMAAEQALTRAAPVEAAAFLNRALEAGRAMRVAAAELATVSVRQAEAFALAGRFEQAGASLQEARRRARGIPLQEAAICHEIARQRERSRHMAQAVRWTGRGLKILDEAPPGPEADSLRAQLWLARAVARMRAGLMAEAVDNAARAAELAQRSGNRMALGRAYTVLHWGHTEIGSPERATYRGLALPIFEELEDHGWQGRTLNNLGIDAYWSGDWEGAVALYERGRAALERVGDVVEAAVLLNNIAEIRSDQGRYDEAEAQLLEALSTCRAACFAQGVGLLYANLGRVASRRGDTERAAELYAQAREALGEVGAAAKLLELDVHEAERRVLAGDHCGALEMAGAVRAASRERDLQPALLALVQRIAGFAKLLDGDVEGARVRLNESIAMARAAGSSYEEALSLEALGRTGGDEAELAAAEAAKLLRGLGVVRLPAVPLPA